MTTKKMSFEDRALKYPKHTMYCKWTGDGGRYHKGKPCTCGRDAFFLEIVKMCDALRHTECASCGHMVSRCACEAWRLESLAFDRVEDTTHYAEMLVEAHEYIAALKQAIELALPSVEWMAGAIDADPEDHERLAQIRALLGADDEESER